MEIYEIIGYCIDALLFIMIIICLSKKTTKNNAPDSKDKLTFTKNDIMIKKSMKYTVGNNNKVKAGVYALLSPHGTEDFNIRINGLVRNYHNGQSIALAEGDIIQPVSSNVILK